MTLRELYELQRTDGEKGENARAVLAQTHWFTVNAEFDPRTGDALPQALSAFLARVSERKPDARLRDRLNRITEHARPAVERLLRSLNESPRRTRAVLPVRAVRELDAGSFMKLSMRPGRTIREKLAGKPCLQAVRCYQSVDLPENRLLKAFVSRLAELLELRRDVLGEPEDELLVLIRSWLVSDEAMSIRDWENVPPNNTLLSHREYRRVWDAWRRLQTIDDDLARDLEHLEERAETMRRWNDYGRMYREGTHLFAEMPVLFDYEGFRISTWTPEPSVRKAAQRVRRSTVKSEITQAACLDLTETRPRFAHTGSGSGVLTETYLWQQWKHGDDTVDLELFNSDAAYLHPDAATIGLPDLFFASDGIPDHLLDRAARAFACRLRGTFKHDRLIWLIPDALNDFELEILRRNLNTFFPGAEPLPRSVAAVFEQVDYARITEEGYSVVVIDTLGGITCRTKLLARFDEDLKKRLPETAGFYWERCPPIVQPKRGNQQERRYDMTTVASNGTWQQPPGSAQPRFSESQVLGSDPQIGHSASVLRVTHSPVVGGIRLHVLQQGAGDIPLWRDQIPELAIKGYLRGYYRRIPLVSRGTTITPIRGRSVRIPIGEQFTLPAGRRFYQFPLYRGEHAAELKFSARLDSPVFPLKKDTPCELILQFQYGDDEPYVLTFTPRDRSFPPVRATWRRTGEKIVMDAPAPGYPAPRSWDELTRVPKRDKEGTSNLLEWVILAIDRLDDDRLIRPRERAVGSLISRWRQDQYGSQYAYANCGQTNRRVFIHERNFIEGHEYHNFTVGDKLSFEVEEDPDGGLVGRRVGPPDLQEGAGESVCALLSHIRKALYFPILEVWRDGRSITDRKCPAWFARAAQNKISYLAKLVNSEGLPQSVKNELLFLLCCMHKDAPEECIEWVTEQVEGGHVGNPRAVGCALGDVSEEWQRYIFDLVASNPGSDAIRVFAYAIWRAERFVTQFSIKDLNRLVPALLKCVKRIQVQQSEYGTGHVSAKPLELLLGLLRTRSSENPGIKKILQPQEEITKAFAQQVDRIEEIVAKTDVRLFSRVKIDVQKPEGVRTPDLLYALRLYLTGDDGANAIHITSVSDTEDD